MFDSVRLKRRETLDRLKLIHLRSRKIFCLGINKGQWNSKKWKILLDFIKKQKILYITAVCYEYPGETELMQTQFGELNYRVSCSKGYVYYPYHVEAFRRFCFKKGFDVFHI